MRERVHVNRTMKDLVADLRLMKSVLLSQYMPFLFAQRQEIGFPSRTEIDVPSPKTTQQWLGWTVVSPPQWALLTVIDYDVITRIFIFRYFFLFNKAGYQSKHGGYSHPTVKGISKSSGQVGRKSMCGAFFANRRITIVGSFLAMAHQFLSGMESLFPVAERRGTACIEKAIRFS